VTFGAEDNTGIRTVSIRDGDRTLETRELACDFRHLPVTITPDLAEGIHTLTTAATDAAGETKTSAVATLKLDRTAPGAPLDFKIDRLADRYVYTWRNPDQGGMAPIAAVHVTDGTVVKGDNIERIEVTDPETSIWLEDAAGNADPANVARVRAGPPLAVQEPILQPAGLRAAKLKITSAKRSGSKLVVRGTIARGVTGKVVATFDGKRASAKPKNGRFTIKVPLRRRGAHTVTVRFGGQGAYAPASVSKRFVYR
jgi:hypothetical protein